MPKEVLIVEDDRALADLLARALQTVGYRVRQAHDGEAALEAIARSQPGLVLLDLLLPRRDGRAVLAELREREETRELPVIAMSGIMRRPKQRREVEEAGAQAFLEKPFQGADLVAMVEAFLGPAAGGPDRDGLSLATTSSAEVLWGAVKRGLTGALHFQLGRKRKALLLREGRPRGIRSNVVRECLGRRLFDAGRISREALEQSLERSRSGEGRQGEILVRMGAVSRAEVDEALQRQGEEKLLELFSWTEGQVWFERETEDLPLSTPVEECNPEELILRGVQRMRPDAIRRGLASVRQKSIALDLSGLSDSVQRDPAVERARDAVERARGRLDEVVRQHGNVLYGLLVLGAVRADGDQAQSELKDIAERVVPAAAKAGPVTHAELEEVLSGQSGQTHFEVLGVPEGATAAQCKAAFFTLAKRYHPDRFAGETEEVRAVAGDLFARISVAHEALTDPEQRQEYVASLLGKGEAEGEADVSQILTAEVQFQKGEVLLKKRDYARALEQFRWAMELNPEEGEYRALHAWAAYLMNPEDPQAVARAREELGKAVELAPRSVTGYYYLGQLLKACGEAEPAEKMFRQVLELSPGHIEAARELRVSQMRRDRAKASGRKSGLFGLGRKKD